jgi:hypothetical protein
MRGLAHLHVLLDRPDADVPAVVLAGGDLTRQDGLEILDDESRRTLRAKLAEIDAELAQAERADLRHDRDAIASYLASGTALGGRHRTTGATAERARVAVRKAIVAALARIAESDPWLGRHLHERVRTGLQCRYDVDPDRRVEWVLRAPDAA